MSLLPVLLLAASAANVLVVINDNSPQSRELGVWYAQQRALPSANLCRIRTTADETISRDVYERQIAAPVMKYLRERRLSESILYIVTTLGVPLRIDGSGGGRMADNAAVDSELTLLYGRLKDAKDPPVAGPLQNPFFGQREVPFSHPRFPMYLVTRLAGYSVEHAKALVTRCRKATNRGRFVIDSGVDNSGGNALLERAARLLPEGRVLLDATPQVLYGVDNVIGYAAWGSNDPGRKRRLLGFKWLPGAIMTEFVSTNARTFQRPPDQWTIGSDWKSNLWFGSPQSLIGDYIAEGVSGTSGHVYEPFLSFTPRPDYLLPAWADGRNLAESYYLSMPALSWQNVVIGDPLCSLGAR